MCGDGKEAYRSADELYQEAEQKKKVKKDKKKDGTNILEDSFR